MLVGRTNEIKELLDLYKSDQAELCVIYGRRRIGKTFLVNEVFDGKFAFKHAGLNPDESNKVGLLKEQLKHFYNSLLLYGLTGYEQPTNWLDAFYLLERLLMKKDPSSKQVVFIDELPWLDTFQSNFIRAFEGFWNTWACSQKNLLVIVSGSANSWIQNKLINNHGGLYNRVTREIKLSPFTLKECSEYYKSKNIVLSTYDMVQSYMIFGGVPYYLSYLKNNLSLAQNIDKVFFDKNAPLKYEYDRLFNSTFSNPDKVKLLIEALHKRSYGYNREEIKNLLGISDGCTLTNTLNALLSSDFIVKYVPFGSSKKQPYYKLTDSFCIFYLDFIKYNDKKNEKFWQQNVTSASINTWRGIAFENVCFNHIDSIKNALGISGVISEHSSWSKHSDSDGFQIDLLIVRNDNVINMCEMKFYSNLFNVDKDYYYKIISRNNSLSNIVSPKVTIHNTLITTLGIKENEYSNVFLNVITIDDFFK